MNKQAFQRLIIPLMFLCAIILISCSSSRSMGGQIKGESYSADYDRPSSRAKKDYAPPPSAPKPAMSEERNADDFAGSEPSPEGESEKEPETKDQDETVIIYEADCSLSVQNVRDSVIVITKMASDTGGFIENSSSSDSYRTAYVVVRVPSAKLDAFLLDLSKVGSVERKEVRATNVSDQYNDIATRMKSAEKVRDRLVELLKKTRDATDRIAILKEIDRVNARVESMKAQLLYLKGLADYSTVRISLRAERQASVKRYLPSPFAWVSGLLPDSRSIKKLAPNDVTLPQGYFFLKKDFEEGGKYLYALPGNISGVRIGETENYPKMDAPFWREAFELETTRRMYKKSVSLVLKSAVGEFAVYHFSVSGGKWYTAAFMINGDAIIAIEADYDSEKTFTAQRKNIEDMIASYGGKK